MDPVLEGPDRFGADAKWSRRLLSVGLCLPLTLATVSAAVVIVNGPSPSDIIVATAFVVLAIGGFRSREKLFDPFHNHLGRIVLLAALLSLLTWPAGGIASTFASLPVVAIGAALLTNGARGVAVALVTEAVLALADAEILGGFHNSRVTSSLFGAIAAPVIVVCLVGLPRTALIAVTGRGRNGPSRGEPVPGDPRPDDDGDCGPSNDLIAASTEELRALAATLGVPSIPSLDPSWLQAAVDALPDDDALIVSALPQAPSPAAVARIPTVAAAMQHGEKWLSEGDAESIIKSRVRERLARIQRTLETPSLNLQLFALGALSALDGTRPSSDEQTERRP